MGVRYLQEEIADIPERNGHTMDNGHTICYPPYPMGELQELAHEIGAGERTLRRAVRAGAVRCRRPGPRRLSVSEEERRYLRDHWDLLSALRAALRTEPNVRLAVLFGSTARGEDTPESDVDLFVTMRDPSLSGTVAVGTRLSDAVGREVQLIPIEKARKTPTLLAAVLRDGRVIVDRDGEWRRLRLRRHEVDREAHRYRADLRRRAFAALGRPVPREWA